MKQWILLIIAASILYSIFEIMLPDGRLKKVTLSVVSLVVTVIIINCMTDAFVGIIKAGL